MVSASTRTISLSSCRGDADNSFYADGFYVYDNPFGRQVSSDYKAKRAQALSGNATRRSTLQSEVASSKSPLTVSQSQCVSPKPSTIAFKEPGHLILPVFLQVGAMHPLGSLWKTGRSPNDKLAAFPTEHTRSSPFVGTHGAKKPHRHSCEGGEIEMR